MSKVLLLIKDIKEFGYSRRSNLIFRISVVLVLAIVITMMAISMSYSQKVNKGLANNLIRLHVVANSDSEQDQRLKIDVRDAVINYMEAELKDSRDLEETKFIINKNMNNIKQIAQDKVLLTGKDYPVSVKLGDYPFPTKEYGDVTLPAGEYQALKIVIGNGIGANWWCVLFPPLCFVDATHGMVPDDVKDDLKKVLTEDEYDLITSVNSEGDIPIKVKFKVVEFFQDSSIKFSGFLNKLFGIGKK